MVAPPLKGGEDFAGKRGRETANTCEASTRQANVTVAHFTFRGLIKFRRGDKKILAPSPFTRKLNLDCPSGRRHFPVSDFAFPIIFPRRCHSLLIVHATRRAVWLKACSIAQIAPLRSGRLNRNNAFRFGSIWWKRPNRWKQKRAHQLLLTENCGCSLSLKSRRLRKA